MSSMPARKIQGFWQTDKHYYRMTKEETRIAGRGAWGMIPARIWGEDPEDFSEQGTSPVFIER